MRKKEINWKKRFVVFWPPLFRALASSLIQTLCITLTYTLSRSCSHTITHTHIPRIQYKQTSRVIFNFAFRALIFFLLNWKPSVEMKYRKEAKNNEISLKLWIIFRSKQLEAIGRRLAYANGWHGTNKTVAKSYKSLMKCESSNRLQSTHIAHWYIYIHMLVCVTEKEVSSSASLYQ